MQIVKPLRIRAFAQQHARAKTSLLLWLVKAKAARWTHHQDARQTFPSADPVRVASGRSVTVFNIGGNHYRLITAIHYDRQKIYVLRFMTHAEYTKDRWKDEL